MALFNFSGKNSAPADNQNLPADQTVAPAQDNPMASSDADAQNRYDQNISPQPADNGVKLTVESEDEPDSLPVTDTPSIVEETPEPTPEIPAENPEESPVPEAEDPIEKYNREQAEAAMQAVGVADPAVQAAEDAINESNGPVQASNYDAGPNEDVNATDQVSADVTSETNDLSVFNNDPSDQSQDESAGDEFEDMTSKILEKINSLVAKRKEIEDKFETDKKALKEKRDLDVAEVDSEIDSEKATLNSALNNIRRAVEALPNSKSSHDESQHHQTKK